MSASVACVERPLVWGPDGRLIAFSGHGEILNNVTIVDKFRSPMSMIPSRVVTSQRRKSIIVESYNLSTSSSAFRASRTRQLRLRTMRTSRSQFDCVFRDSPTPMVRLKLLSLSTTFHAR